MPKAEEKQVEQEEELSVEVEESPQDTLTDEPEVEQPENQKHIEMRKRSGFVKPLGGASQSGQFLWKDSRKKRD